MSILAYYCPSYKIYIFWFPIFTSKIAKGPILPINKIYFLNISYVRISARQQTPVAPRFSSPGIANGWVRFWWTKMYYYIRSAARHLLLEGFAACLSYQRQWAQLPQPTCSKPLRKHCNQPVRCCKARQQAIKTMMTMIPQVWDDLIFVRIIVQCTSFVVLWWSEGRTSLRRFLTDIWVTNLSDLRFAVFGFFISWRILICQDKKKMKIETTTIDPSFRIARLAWWSNMNLACKTTDKFKTFFQWFPIALFVYKCLQHKRLWVTYLR